MTKQKFNKCLIQLIVDNAIAFTVTLFTLHCYRVRVGFGNP